HIANEFNQLFVRRPTAHEFMEIVIPDGEQAGANLSVGGDSDAAAVTAEGMRNRRDDSDLADAVVEMVAARGLAPSVREIDQGPVLSHARNDLLERNHDRRRPGPVFLQRHELNETDDDALFTGKHTEGNDLIFIKAAHQDAIDLHWP